MSRSAVTRSYQLPDPTPPTRHAGLPSAAWNDLRGFEPVSFCDWPDRISGVLFFGGCNLRCPTCHNALLAWHPEKAGVLSRSEVCSAIETKRSWLEGLVLTGGEPTIVEDLDLLIDQLARFGLPIKIDTNGMRPEVVARLLATNPSLTFAVDVKGPWDKYPELTGLTVTPDKARSNLESIFDLARRSPSSFYFRCTRVPLLDDDDIDCVRSCLPSGFELVEQKYRP